MSTQPNTVVIIPCLNEERHIEQLVGQLLRHNPTCLRIVIADGGSIDRTPDIAQQLASQHPNVVYLHNPKRLQSAAVNLAVATYGHDCEFLIRLDAHADYPEHYCKMLIEEAVTTKATSVVVAMNTKGVSCFQRAVAAASNSKLGNGGSAHRLMPAEGKWVDHGHHALMRIDAFNSINGYDETFSHNEDAELDTRLRNAGFSIWLTARTSLVYYPRSSPIGLFKQYVHYGRGRVRNLLKHRSRPRLRQMLPVAVAPTAILALATPWCWLMAIPLTTWATICLTYGMLLGKKNNDVCVMASGVTAMIMHLAWSIGFWKGLLHALTEKRS